MIKKFSTVLLTILAASMPMLSTSPVYAQTAASKAICEGADDGSANASCTGDTSAESVNKIVRLAIGIFQTIVGIIALFTMIRAGLNYIMADGDSAKLKTARERIIYGAIGLVIVGIAQAVVQFVLNRV